MKNYKISLNSIDKVKDFVSVVEGKEDTYEIVSGTHIINAKSILGIFSLDLSKTLNLRTDNEHLPSEIRGFLV